MPEYDAKGNVIPAKSKPGLLAKIRGTTPEEQAPPPPPEPNIVRQQPSRQPRSKRTGSKKS
jgi:YidC/Oxa1 family membrane protein insertase